MANDEFDLDVQFSTEQQGKDGKAIAVTETAFCGMTDTCWSSCATCSYTCGGDTTGHPCYC